MCSAVGRLAWVGLLGVTLVSPARAQSFTQIVSFGDSLSDTGNVSNATFGISPGGNYFNGRFSNGPLWVEALAGSLNLAAPTPSRIPGGRNYAHGGTKTGPGSTTYVFFSFPNAGTQISQYLSGNTPTSSQLISLYSGANDFLDNLGQNPTTIVNNLVNHVTALNNAGARYIIVPNLPLLGYTPRYVGNAAERDAYNNLTASFNTQLAAAMTTLDAQIPAKIYQFDVASAFDEIRANPSRYGLTNVTQPALVGSTVVPNPDEYLFYDDVHPTRVGHRLLGIAAYDLVSTHQWIGGAGVWSDSAKWDVAGTPAAAWIAVIDNQSTQPYTVDVAASSQVRRIRVSGTSSPVTLHVAGAATLSASDLVTINSNATLDLAGRIDSPGVEIFPNGRIIGNGSISGNLLNNSGTMAPGSGGVGSLQVGGNFEQKVSGSLDIELGGASGVSDRVAAGGLARFGGFLRLFSAAGETPLPGNLYEVMSFASGSTGDFSIQNHTGFAGLRFAEVNTTTTLSIELSAFPGDANLDAIVNIADFASLAASFNATGLNWLGGDFTFDGAVTIADFSLLASNFNLAAPAQRSSVPEPAGIVGTIGLVSVIAGRRRRV